jgi:four helix bundle protein
LDCLTFGRLDGWTVGLLDGWTFGGLDCWTVGRFDGWRVGGLEGWIFGGSMKIETYRDLRVFQLAFDLANEIFELSRKFPKEEKYSLTDQILRSSRSTCANIAEAYGSRLYEKMFISKLVIALSEATETQVWLDFCKINNYIHIETYNSAHKEYGHVIAMIKTMIKNVNDWTV